MYILDINLKKTIIFYTITTVISYIFSIVYLKFSYGVVSNYMKYIALIPLILGVAVYAIVYIINKTKSLKCSRWAYNLYNAAIFTFMVGNGVNGIFEICGANSFYTIIYFIIGIILSIVALGCFVIAQIRLKNNG